MNPEHLWVTGAMQLLTFFVIGPVIAIAIAYSAWRGKPQALNAKRYGIVCAVCWVTATLLLTLAKWINADVRTPQYFVQLTCVLLGLLFGFVGVGSFLPVLLHLWRWHQTTRLADQNRTEP
jgi:threonine/homoserine/homoserine lactone efflux protein